MTIPANSAMGAMGTTGASSALEELIARATAADGSPPFSDGALVELATGRRELFWLGPAAAITKAGEAEFVVDPDARRQGHGTRTLEALLGAEAPDGRVLFWAHGNHPGARALAASHGLEPVRELLHLQAPVPETVATPTAVTGFTAADAEDWLELNARAFARHPEQGAITRLDLDALIAEPWFDADDLLLLREGGTLIGYCWLKVQGGEGEFYVVGVSPERQREGIGRLLLEAGFARLASRGIRTAHLYVEGDNAPALALYDRFGFTRRSVDVRYLASAGKSS